MKRIALALAALFALTVPSASPAFAQATNAHYKRGMIYKRKGDVNQAIAELEKAVAQDESHAPAWGSLGHLYKHKQMYPEAINAYEKATALSPKDPVLWSNLGMAYFRGGRSKDALTALWKACKLDPKNAEIQANLGAIHRQEKNLDRALHHLRWSVKLAPKEAPFHSNLGLALRVAGSETEDEAKRDQLFTEAVSHFKTAIELDPNEPRYYFNAAVVYRRWEKIDEAIQYYDLAVAKEPSMHPAWYDLGHMHRLNRDNDKAIAAFTKYLELTEGQDPKADEEVREAIESLGGKAPPPKKGGKATKGKAPGKK